MPEFTNLRFFVHKRKKMASTIFEAIEAEEEENSWINDDDIDFDEYEDYYEED